MALPKIQEARNLSDEELADEIVAAKRRLFELRLQRATGRLEKTHEFKHTRHWIAQLMTVERERQLHESASQSEAHSAEDSDLEQAQPQTVETV